MEADKNSMRNPDDSRNAKDGMEEIDLHMDRNVSGKDIVEEGKESRRHHQEYGNRKYKSYTNHSSADDQPQVNTDWNPER